MKLTLEKTVKYRSYGEQVYLRNITSRKDYLFNDIVFDILEIIRTTPYCTENDLLHSLSEMYAVEDQDTFQTDITTFLEKLLQEEIISDDASSGKEQDTHVSDLIQEQCSREHRLYCVCLELTYRCNERCIHCYIDNQTYQKELGFDQYKELLDELAEMGCMYLLLTGGELTLHPDFLRIAEYASEKGFLVDIYTNGYHITEDMIRRMIALAPNSISFSFYGGDAKSHDAITGIPGSFEKSLKTMMIFKCAGVDTFIKSIALKQNYDSIEKIYLLGELLDIPVVVAKGVIPSHTGEKKTTDCRLETEQQYKRLLDLEQIYRGKEVRERIWEPGMPFCSAGISALSIDPYGNVTPCNSFMIPLGSILSQSIQEIWNRSIELMKAKVPDGYLKKECASCESRRFCNICLGMVIDSDGEQIADDQTCLIAKAACHTYQERRYNHEKRV